VRRLVAAFSIESAQDAVAATRRGLTKALTSQRTPKSVMPSVALICTANRCRSVMAHAIFIEEARKRSLTVDIYSAGILDFSDQPPLIETSRTCRHYHTPPPKETPTWIRELPLASIDRFLGDGAGPRRCAQE